MSAVFIVRAQVVDASVHLAVYEFDDVAQMRAIFGSATRTREVVQVAQRIG